MSDRDGLRARHHGRAPADVDRGALATACGRTSRVIGLTPLSPPAPAWSEPAIERRREIGGRPANKDYVFLGYKSGFQSVMIGIGESLRQQFPVDFYGTRSIRSRCIRGIDSYQEHRSGHQSHRLERGRLLDSVRRGPLPQATDLGLHRGHGDRLLPYLSSRQLLGLIGGMKGAAEYEKRFGIHGRRPARHGRAEPGPCHRRGPRSSWAMSRF